MKAAIAIASIIVLLTAGCRKQTQEEHDQMYGGNFKVDSVGDATMESWFYRFHDNHHVCSVIVHTTNGETIGEHDWEVSTYFPDQPTQTYRLPTFTSAEYLADEYCHGFIKPF